MTTLTEALDYFIRVKDASLRSPETLKWYRSIIGACIEDIGGHRDVTTITDDDMLSYITDMRKRDVRYVEGKQKPPQVGRMSTESIRTHIRALKAFWSWTSKKYDMTNPMDTIPMPKRRDPRPKSIEPNDFCRLFNSTFDIDSGTRDRAILALLADTGARAGGLLSILVDTVDTVRGRAQVLEKGYKQRWIYWSFHTSKLVEKWLAVRNSKTNALIVSMVTGKPLTYSGLAQLLARLKKRSNVKGRVNAHAFRHNFARMYLLGGGDLVSLARLLGHTDVNITAAYYAVFADDELSDLQKKYSPLNQMLD